MKKVCVIVIGILLLSTVAMAKEACIKNDYAYADVFNRKTLITVLCIRDRLFVKSGLSIVSIEGKDGKCSCKVGEEKIKDLNEGATFRN